MVPAPRLRARGLNNTGLTGRGQEKFRVRQDVFQGRHSEQHHLITTNVSKWLKSCEFDTSRRLLLIHAAVLCPSSSMFLRTMASSRSSAWVMISRSLLWYQLFISPQRGTVSKWSPLMGVSVWGSVLLAEPWTGERVSLPGWLLRSASIPSRSVATLMAGSPDGRPRYVSLVARSRPC